jgi:23S rRNA maturation mini-RNase III
MDRQAAIQEIRQKALDIGTAVTAMHPRVAALNDAGAQAEILKALFELTKQVEVVKKHLLKLEKRDDSALL